MSYAMQFATTGGPERFQRVGTKAMQPGAGEVLVRQKAIGLNFVDVYHRTGAYPLPLPGIAGVEGAGLIEAVGEGVWHLVPGQPVAYAGAVGAYADCRILPAWRAIAVPDALALDEVGGSLLRGLTVHMLLTRVYPVSAGMSVLVHAGAGGLGAIIIRWAKVLGAEVIATVGSKDKAVIAHGHGADHVIVGRDVDLQAEVSALTEGKGVHLAVDGIGGATLRKSIACVRPFGLTASLGQVAGIAPPVPLDALRSNALARPSVMAYCADHAVYAPAVEAVFAMMQRGLFDRASVRYELEAVATAHADLEAGRILGHALLIP